jgi:hypothetical protein
VPYPDFSDQVYELWEIGRRTFADMDPLQRNAVELVWVLPPGTCDAIAGPYDHPVLDRLFGVPAETGDVDRPQIVIRPKRTPNPGPPVIQRGAEMALRDYDRATDPLYGYQL